MALFSSKRQDDEAAGEGGGAPPPRSERTPGWAAADKPVGFFMRAFCLYDRVPSLGQMLEWLRDQEIILRPDRSAGFDPISQRWEQAVFYHEQDETPITIQCSRDDGTPRCMLREETGEFLHRVGRPGLSGTKRRVLKHLKETKVIVACKLPPGERNRQALHVHLQMLRFYMARCKGLLQIDGEGFYEHDRLLLDMSKRK